MSEAQPKGLVPVDLLQTPLSVSIKQENLEPTIINPLEQEEGVGNLREYFDEKIAFEEVRPFLVDTANFYGRQAHLRVGRVKNQSIFIFLNQELTTVLRTNNKLLAVPRQDEGKHYQWVDFYAIRKGSSVNFSEALGSYRVNKQNNKIDTRGWNCYENQSFLDFLSGENSISPNELRPFKVKIGRSHISNREKYKKDQASALIGQIGDRAVRTGLGDIDTDEDEILIAPKFNAKYGYSWIEGYIKDYNDDKPVISKRFYSGSPRFYEWKGVEIQLLVDWINGFMSFEEVLPVKIKPPPSLHIDLESTNEENIFIRLSKKDVTELDEVVLVPKKDRLYEWIEIYKVKKTGEVEHGSVASCRVTRDEKAKLDGAWPGPRRQAYIDYFDGKINIDLLEPLQIKVGQNGTIYLFSYKNKALCLPINGVDIQAGKIITVKPTQNSDDNLVVEVWKENKDKFSKSFQFDKKTMCFKAIRVPLWSENRIETEAGKIYKEEGTLSHEILKRRRKRGLSSAITKDYPGGMTMLIARLEGADWASRRVDKETGKYEDEKGSWRTISALSEIFHVSREVLINRLKDTQTVNGVNARGLRVTLFNEAEVELRLKPFLSLPQSDLSNSDIFLDQDGKEWISISSLAAKMGISKDIVLGNIGNTKSIKIRGKRNIITRFFALEEAIRALEESGCVERVNAKTQSISPEEARKELNKFIET